MIEAETDEGYPIKFPCSFYNYKFIEIIGYGSTSVVALVEDEQTGQLFSAKIVPKMYIERKNLMNSIQKEIKVLTKIDHPNIIKIYKNFELKNRFNESYIIMILEYCSNGDLLTFITNFGFTDEFQKKKIFSGFLKAINYLHSQNISHGDIKPENILLDKNMNPKISDFGYCRTALIGGDEEKRGTLNFAAPELFFKGVFDTQKSDIWAIGITLYCLSENKFPFKKGNASFIINQIKSGKLCLCEKISPSLRNLVKKCTDLKPSNRPTIEEIINDEYFSNENQMWDCLKQNNCL